MSHQIAIKAVRHTHYTAGLPRVIAHDPHNCQDLLPHKYTWLSFDETKAKATRLPVSDDGWKPAGRRFALPASAPESPEGSMKLR
jgi:hypothetical protein